VLNNTIGRRFNFDIILQIIQLERNIVNTYFQTVVRLLATCARDYNGAIAGLEEVFENGFNEAFGFLIRPGFPLEQVPALINTALQGLQNDIEFIFEILAAKCCDKEKEKDDIVVDQVLISIQSLRNVRCREQILTSFGTFESSLANISLADSPNQDLQTAANKRVVSELKDAYRQLACCALAAIALSDVAQRALNDISISIIRQQQALIPLENFTVDPVLQTFRNEVQLILSMLSFERRTQKENSSR
jgi:hypothetical protein